MNNEHIEFQFYKYRGYSCNNINDENTFISVESGLQESLMKAYN